MAKQATEKTKKTIRIPLVGSAQNRQTDPNKDQRFVNFIPESNKTPINNATKIFLVKRSGLELYSSPDSNAVGRGCYYYAGHLYSVFDDILYRDLVQLQVLSTTTGVIGWAEATGATNYLFVCDGTDGYVITAAGVITKVNVTHSAWVLNTNYAMGDRVIPTVDNGFYYEVTVDAGSSGGTQPTWPVILGNTVVDGGITWECKGSYGGFPTPHIPTPVFLDGYLFLAKSNSADIYNSDLVMPESWSAANFITAEMFPDNVLALARQNNLVVALGQFSVEFFFDSGTSTTSPLARNAPMVQQFGTCAPYATFQNEKFCMVVGQSGTGGRCVWQIDGSTPKKVSTEYIEKILDAEGSTIFTSTSFGVRTQGHFLFVLTLDTRNRTLVYDVEEKMWHEWSSGGTNKFAGKFVTDMEAGYVLVQHATDGNIYTLKPTKYTDDGVAITCTATTAKLDFDSMNRKQISDMYVIGDTNPLTTTLSFRWSDDDYQTWSSWHTLDLSKRPVWNRNGVFRRRAYQFSYADNYPCRLESVEFDVRMMEH